NECGASISVIDVATDKVVDTIKDQGEKPRGLAASGDNLYVRQKTNNQRNIVDLKQRKVIGSVSLGDSPEGVYVSADGRWIAAAIEENNTVAIIDTQTNQMVDEIKVKGDNPEHAVFSPDGKKLLVS